MKFLIWGIFLTIIIASCSSDGETLPPPPESKTETFTFTSNGIDTKGKIFLPASYATNNNLPAIYLIDYQEQHFDVVTDEFDEVVKAVQLNSDIEAMVVTLHEHPDIDAKPEEFQEYYDVFKNMTAYVDRTYTNNI